MYIQVKKLITILNLGTKQHPVRRRSLGMLFLGYKDIMQYSYEHMSNLLDKINVSKARNIKLLIKECELIKKANFEYDSEIKVDLENFYNIGYSLSNSDELKEEIKNVWVIIATQFLKYITELADKTSNLE